MDRDKLMSAAAGMNLPLTAEQADRLVSYADAILAENRNVNLTALTGEDAFLVRNLLDSLTAAALPELSGKVADLGTGGGFPGAVIAVFRPDCAVTMIDAAKKKLRAAKAACSRSGIPAEFLHGRAEELGRKPEYRGRFDTVCARAVASLPVLLEYCLPLTAAGGCFIAMKGPDAAGELEMSGPALKALGGTAERVAPAALPDGSVRNLIVVRKTGTVPDLYPRREKIIRGCPL